MRYTSVCVNSMTESAQLLIRNLVHDLRQPLSTVESCVYYLSMVAPNDGRMRQHLDLIQAQVEEASRILNQAVEQSHPQRETRAAGESFDFTKATTSALT